MPENVGERIKAARIKNHFTQEELATRIGTTKQNIYKYETGIITNIPLDKVESIAAVLSVDVAELLGWAKPSTPVLSEMEARLLRSWRGADESARQHALIILESSQVEPKKEQNA